MSVQGPCGCIKHCGHMTEWLHDFHMKFFTCYLKQCITCPAPSMWVELSTHHIHGTNVVHACMGENGHCVMATCVHQNKHRKVHSQEPYRVKMWPPKKKTQEIETVVLQVYICVTCALLWQRPRTCICRNKWCVNTKKQWYARKFPWPPPH